MARKAIMQMWSYSWDFWPPCCPSSLWNTLYCFLSHVLYLTSLPTFGDSSCVHLIWSHWWTQFNLLSDGFQAFCCDSSHNMRAKRGRSDLKRIRVREEMIALMLTSEEKGGGAQGCLFSRLLKGSTVWDWGDGRGAVPLLGTVFVSTRTLWSQATEPTLTIIPERNVLIGQAVALGLTREGGEAACKGAETRTLPESSTAMPEHQALFLFFSPIFVPLHSRFKIPGKKSNYSMWVTLLPLARWGQGTFTQVY